MSPEYVLGFAIEPALDLLGPQFGSVDAERMLLAIGLQESRFLHRAQIGGPARGYWQFELGGVRGVLAHHASKSEAGKLCAALDYVPSEDIVYGALANNDILAAGIARLLLYTDPLPLPKTAEDGWAYYVRNWRPGKPRPESWADCWTRASSAVR